MCMYISVFVCTHSDETTKFYAYSSRSIMAAGTSSQQICGSHLLFWHTVISTALLAVCDGGGRMAARLSDSLVFVYPG